MIVCIYKGRTKQLTQKTKMKNVLIALVFTAILLAIIIKATDRICDKTYSAEFKQTQEYKSMQCPNN